MSVRTRDCAECGSPFSFEVGKGRDLQLCSDFCRTKRRHKNKALRPLCVVEGCKNTRDYSSGICNPCYIRARRTGTTERRQWKYRSVTSHGYVRISDKTHPLSAGKGALYEHRQVLYDAIGEGPHSCHWCGIEVRWMKGLCVKGSLVPDHLDGDKANNTLSNLVPACNRCNANRGLFMAWVRKHQDDPLLWQMYESAKKSIA